MASCFLQLLPTLLASSFFLIISVTTCMGLSFFPKPYIVYMGGGPEMGGPLAETYSEYLHLQMLSSVISREESHRISILQTYNHAFGGFAAMLTDQEASALSRHNEVVSVFPDAVFELHTTRSWDFLGMVESYSNNKSSYYYRNGSSNDVIIGLIDTGIWPESPSFNDEGIGEIPARWKGVCMEGFAFTKSNCNRKLIGARFYNNLEETLNNKPKFHGKSKGSPRDSVGHGTHTASIAAGATVEKANYFGLANGTARGGLPSARIASYKACSTSGCSGSAILKAIDDAIKDGVDIISISIGSSDFQSDFLRDPIAIGAFHASQRGVTVVCSAGNDGPYPRTVTNTAPWIFTVAASTIDRKFETTVLLGNRMYFKGTAVSVSLSGHPSSYPLAYAEHVAADPSLRSGARICAPGTLNTTEVTGKIVVCMHDDLAVSRTIKKLVVEDAGAKGLILIDGFENSSPFDSGAYPFAEVRKDLGFQILKYINTTKYPIATIFPAKEVRNIRQAPIVADFSSRGPASLTQDVLKPDIMAPGVSILAATVPDETLTSTEPSFFSITSGTSMACPHVAGVVAFVKSVHPKWSSSMIKSAIMTTASISSNNGNPLMNTSNFQANPHEMGAGEINPTKALDPGLVFETRTSDYLNFLCFYGYQEKHIRAISKTAFECQTNGTARKLVPNINFPSISIGEQTQQEGVTTVKRVATNVGPTDAAYVSSVVAPKGLNVKVSPKMIVFNKGKKKSSFSVSFDGRKASKGYHFGAIVLSDGVHVVRLVFAVNIAN
ncbi:unnamed protein product [Cuscuta epithymum]|uniref:Uncharacterized protein n=1 Tax=Cuscuta epithymum TaxID=186058 RepID=A0AAV0CW41_9ASTE|nr:unnamed protein product [Cuscuta epithymum]